MFLEPKVKKYANLQESKIEQVVSHPNCEFETGEGWCKVEYKSNAIYYGFIAEGECVGPGCLLDQDGWFFNGVWRDDKLIDGCLHRPNGTIPLQYQCTRLSLPTVKAVSDLLCKIGVKTPAHVLAAKIIELNKNRLPQLTRSAGLQHHTILLLPRNLQATFRNPSRDRGRGITSNCNASGRLDFLVGAIVEVSSLHDKMLC